MSAAEERMTVSRTIAAPAGDVFAVLTDPSRHQDIEPNDWVRTAIEPQALTPGQFDDDGLLQVGGWWWRYDLEPVGEQTEVTLTYDWSGTPQRVLDEIGSLPPFGLQFLEESLTALERTASG